MLGQNLLHLSQSLFGMELICWIKAAPASVVFCNFLSAAMRACSCSFVTMAASVRSKLKLGISECRWVASPAPARAFVPARGSQVRLQLFHHRLMNLCVFVSPAWLGFTEFSMKYTLNTTVLQHGTELKTLLSNNNSRYDV